MTTNINAVTPGGTEVIALDQIQFDRSITANAVPTAATLEEGSIAINLVDRRIFTKDHNGDVISLGRDFTADIAAAQSNAIAAANTFTTDELTALRGGALDTDLDTLLKLGTRIAQAEASIVTSNESLEDLTKADIGLGNVENFGISDTVTEDNSSQYASSAAAFAANTRAEEAEENAMAYADQIKADLLGGAVPETLDTLAEIALELQNNDTEVSSIVSALASRATTAFVNDQLALKIDISSISNAIDSDSEVNVASSLAVRDSLIAAQAYTDEGLALKVDISSISSAINSDSITTVANSAAVSAAVDTSIEHSNALVLTLASNLNYGRTF